MTLGNYLERGYPLLNLSTLNADGRLGSTGQRPARGRAHLLV
jgi:hypothetical protein